MDRRLIWMRSIQDDGVSDQATEMSLGPFRERSGRGLLVLGLAHADLDQLMLFESILYRTHDLLCQPWATDLNHWTELVCEAAEVLSLGSGHFHDHISRRRENAPLYRTRPGVAMGACWSRKRSRSVPTQELAIFESWGREKD